SSQLFSSTQALYAAMKPDFVSVCTWPPLHAPMTIEAAQRGARGIICEKPMALDGGEIRQMREACEKAGARLAIAHQRRYEPHLQRARQILQGGEIGGDFVLEARVADGWDMFSWTVHWFDMANFLLDDMPASVLGGVDHTGQRRYQHAVENAAIAFVEYPR